MKRVGSTNMTTTAIPSSTTTTPALDVARSRWDEASRIVQALKIAKSARRRRAELLHGKPGVEDAWDRVNEAEALLTEAEALEHKASIEVAYAERAVNEARLVARYKRSRGR
jgi:hypothetical protein